MHSISNKFFLCSIFAALISSLLGCVPPKVAVEKEEHLIPQDTTDVEKIVEAQTDWVEYYLAAMSLEEKVAQLISVRAYGYYYSDESELFQKLVRDVRDRKYGGVCVFQGDIYETAVLLNRLQKLADIPLLVSSDFEWGAAMRLRRATRFPENMAVGAAYDTSLAFEMGKIIAREARAIGIHQVFAPVADVNNNPNNPVINTRSFGEQPKLVADMAVAMCRGLQSGGVIATAKHFPGHGDTDIDSHVGLPIISHNRNRLDSVEFFPFRKLVEQGVMSIMTAHVAMPAIENKKKLPATLSTSIINGVLRTELGFDGLIVTDAMEMKALTNNYHIDSIAVMAVEAGCDMLLLPVDGEATVNAILNAVRSGRITEERINQSVKKILAIKQWLGLDQDRFVDLEKIGSVVAVSDHQMNAKRIARSAVTVLKNNNILPLKSYRQRIASIIVSDVEDYRTEVHREASTALNERVGNYFVSQLRARTRSVTPLRLNSATSGTELNSIERQANAADVILVLVYSKARSGARRFGLPNSMISAASRLMNIPKPKIVIALGSPYVLQVFPNAQAYICSYSDAEPVVEATVEALFGEIPTRGKLPVTIPGMFTFGSGLDLKQTTLLHEQPQSVGFNSALFAKVDTAILKAIKDSAFPGAQVVVVKNGVMVMNKAFGRLEYSDTSSQVTDTTMYDIASLTKVVSTTSAIMKLYEEGKLALDDPVVKYIPEFRTKGKEKITIRNLLLHNSGLPAFKSLLTSKSVEECLDSVFNSELIYTPGDSTVYSDFGFIVLGKIIERVAGMPLDVYSKTTFFEPLGMNKTMYNPPESLWSNVAPTEFDTLWRKKLVRGTVHDENAFMLGGVSGHAGLFSTASDLAIFVQMLMNGGIYSGKTYLKPETINLFTKRQGKKSTRALGWDTKSITGYSSAGTLFSEKSFGHTGFTGTSIWVEPEKKIFVILLTNRVYPTRNNNKIMQIRPKVHDTVIKSVIN